VVFDLVGGEVLARSSALLKPGGTLVSVVWRELPADRDDIRKIFFIQEAKQVQLTELARLSTRATCAPRSAACIRSPRPSRLPRQGGRRHPRPDGPPP